MKTIVQFGLAALAAGAQKPATVAVSKSGQGVGEQKQTASKAGKKHTKSVHSTKKGS